MTANVGFVQSHDKAAPFTKTFTHSNGTATELEQQHKGKWLLPRRWTCMSTGTYKVVYNAVPEEGGTAKTDTIPAIAGVKFMSPPHQLHADSTDGIVMVCEY